MYLINSEHLQNSPGNSTNLTVCQKHTILVNADAITRVRKRHLGSCVLNPEDPKIIQSRKLCTFTKEVKYSKECGCTIMDRLGGLSARISCPPTIFRVPVEVYFLTDLGDFNPIYLDNKRFRYYTSVPLCYNTMLYTLLPTSFMALPCTGKTIVRHFSHLGKTVSSDNSYPVVAEYPYWLSLWYTSFSPVVEGFYDDVVENKCYQSTYQDKGQHDKASVGNLLGKKTALDPLLSEVGHENCTFQNIFKKSGTAFNLRYNP
ncbi:hypothetical protein NQ317_007508 [Molorchus minor]|uniref:Uncharacterized protein n=1 Tax=Molorchus minor TaxID=1323400 RepID=A0ABQ9J5H4_9CUCU|nr:hypothetical protein NQ317_007508 [Molorchus minor]